MKKAQTAILETFLLVLFITVSSLAQETGGGDSALISTRPATCVSVTLIADSKTPDRKKTAALTIRIDNRCAEKIRVQEPFYRLERIAPENERVGPAYYRGRTVQRREPYFDNSLKAVEPKDYLQFELNLNRIRWMPSNSSNEVFESLSDISETGDYWLTAQIYIKTSNNKKSKKESIFSNRLKFAFNKN